jgi:hypothetical protein
VVPLLSEGTDAVDFMTRLDSGQLDKAFFEKLFGSVNVDTAQASNPTDRETIQKTIRAIGIPKVNDAMMTPLKSAIENALGVKLETDAFKNDKTKDKSTALRVSNIFFGSASYFDATGNFKLADIVSCQCFEHIISVR